jgi:hypothetical protein
MGDIELGFEDENSFPTNFINQNYIPLKKNNQLPQI